MAATGARLSEDLDAKVPDAEKAKNERSYYGIP